MRLEKFSSKLLKRVFSSYKYEKRHKSNLVELDARINFFEKSLFIFDKVEQVIVFTILTSPGESWKYADKDWNTEKSKTDSGLIRAEYVLYLVEKSVIGCSKKGFSVCYFTKIVKNSLSSNNHRTISKILVFKVLAGQLRNSRHWQGHQRAGA